MTLLPRTIVEAGEWLRAGRITSLELTDALSDFREVLKLNPIDDWATIRVWLVRARMGARREATQELEAAILRRRAGGAPEWVMTISDFLVGRVSQADLLRQAETTNPVSTANRKCEAFFYAGWVKLVENDVTGARILFEQSVATGRDNNSEYSSATAELRRVRRP